MSAPTTLTATRSTGLRRRRARVLAALGAFPAALALSASPAQAVPTEGDPPASAAAGDGRWGCPGADGPVYVGQRYGCTLPPEERGPVLE